MNDDSLITDMYTMIKDSSEKSARIEATLSFMDTRLNKTEELLSRMNDTLNEQKMIAGKVDALQKSVIDNTRRIDALERKEISFIKKYAGIFLAALVTAFAGFVAYKFGVTK